MIPYDLLVQNLLAHAVTAGLILGVGVAVLLMFWPTDRM
jgi:hypothetical protein